MTQENKELLLKDLCARLPYGVKVHAKFIDTDTNTKVEKVGVLSMIDIDTVVAFSSDDTNCYSYVSIHEVKPYLFLLSSMTETQKEEYAHILVMSSNLAYSQLLGMTVEDWLNKNHFDYRGLIEKGLAIDATGLNIY